MAAEEKENEVDVLVPSPRVFKTVAGEEVKLPPVTWGCEIKVLRGVKSILAGLLSSGVFGNTENIDENQLAIQVIEILMDKAPDDISEATAAICGKDKSWVEENLTIETILDILLPFLQSKQASIKKTVEPYLKQMQAQMEATN